MTTDMDGNSECQRCGHPYLSHENVFQHDCRKPLTRKSQGRVMRKPRRTDQDENLRNDVAGMIADICLPNEILGPRLMDGAHQIVVVIRERVLRELESYARENIR